MDLETRRMEFGKYRGETFRTVAEQDTDYCKWALRLPHPSGQMEEFTGFLRQLFGGVLTFGKYADWFFTEVLGDDPSYGEWALGQPRPSARLAEFVGFVREQQQQKQQKQQQQKQQQQHQQQQQRQPRARWKAMGWSDMLDFSSSDSEPGPPAPARKQRRMGGSAADGERLRMEKEEAEAEAKLLRAQVREERAQSERARAEAEQLRAELAKPARGRKTRAPRGGAAATPGDCTICMDAPVETCFVPCGHMAACAECSGHLKKKPCPVCRVVIKQVVRTYRA